MNVRTTISAFFARLRSPRTLLAVVVSVLATVGVGGPLALEAYHARDLLAAERAGAETTDDGDASDLDDLADGGSTTTTTTTTTGLSGPNGSVVTPTTARPGTGGGGTGGPGGVITTTTAGGGGTGSGTGGGTTAVPPTAVPPTTSPPPAPTTTAPGTLVIFVSVSSRLVPFAPLQGKQVTGEVFVFVDLLLGGTVQWRLDGNLIQLTGGRLDTQQIPAGAHTLQAVLTTPLAVLDGTVGFTVAH